MKPSIKVKSISCKDRLSVDRIKLHPAAQKASNITARNIWTTIKASLWFPSWLVCVNSLFLKVLISCVYLNDLLSLLLAGEVSILNSQGQSIVGSEETLLWLHFVV